MALKTPVRIAPLFRDSGRHYKSKALTEREAHYARALIRTRRWPPKQCYASNQMIVLSASGEWRMLGIPACPRGIDLQYVDGFAGEGRLLFEHAWFTINGKVIDVTWREGGRRVLGRFSGVYYGQPFSPKEVRRVNSARGYFGRISTFACPVD